MRIYKLAITYLCGGPKALSWIKQYEAELQLAL